MIKDTQENQSDKKERLSFLSLAGFVFVALLFFAALFFFTRSEIVSTDGSLVQVLGEPDEYYGKTTSLTGEIQEVIGSRAFTLDGPGVVGDQLLVISKRSFEPIGGSPNNALFEDEDQVSVTGVVRKFDIRELEEELGIDLVDSQFAEYEGKPVIIASTVYENE